MLFGCETPGYDGTFATLDRLHDELDEILANAAPMPEDEYYSLAGRIEILQLAADALVSRRLRDSKGKPLEGYEAEDYQIHLGEID